VFLVTPIRTSREYRESWRIRRAVHQPALDRPGTAALSASGGRPDSNQES